MKKLMIGLIAIVLAEIAIFIIIGKAIGVVYTLSLIVLASFIGIFVAKKKGIKSIQNIRNSVANGEAPSVTMIDTFMIFIGGILLVLPGFITDLLGFALLFSFTRNLFKPIIYKWVRKKMKNGQVFIIHK